ncbi:MAG: hypothetical protein IJK40_08490 [Clostridia bacterium]|nr:hypothetical protein [Clostridia bacterium]
MDVRQLKEILRAVAAAPSPTGSEDGAAAVIAAFFENTGAKISADALGNLSVILNPDAPGGVTLTAHMDKIGMIVKAVDPDTGFLRVDRLGGTDARVLAAARVRVYGKKTLDGVVISTPPHLAEKDGDKTALDFSELGIDCGLPAAQMRELVVPGDRILYAPAFYELQGERVSAPYLDNSAGVAAVVAGALDAFYAGCKKRTACVFTTREETGGQGAGAAAFSSATAATLVTDVSFACQPGVRREESSPLGSGAMIHCSPILQRSMTERLSALAEKNGIPFTYEVSSRSTGTDADNIVNAAGGRLTGLVSIPIRNMHTPAELLDLKDLGAVAALFTAYLTDKEGQTDAF